MTDRETLDVHSRLMGLLQRAPYISCADTDRQYAVNWLMNNGVTVLDNCKACAEATQNCIVKLQEQIAELRSVQEWIPVTERLPEKDVLVLCIGSKGGMFIGYPQWVYEDEQVAYTLVPNSRHSRQAKYWMPLPQPPKGE